jgi:hypothetical protein
MPAVMGSLLLILVMKALPLLGHDIITFQRLPATADHSSTQQKHCRKYWQQQIFCMRTAVANLSAIMS